MTEHSPSQHVRKLRLTLASLGALVAVAAVLLGLTWAESTGGKLPGK